MTRAAWSWSLLRRKRPGLIPGFFVSYIYSMGEQLSDLGVFVNLRFKLKQTVYLATDVSQLPRLVKAILLVDGPPQYMLVCGTEPATFHEEFEISDKYNLHLTEAYGEDMGFPEGEGEDEDDEDGDFLIR